MSQLLRGLIYASVAISAAAASPTMAQSAADAGIASVRVDCGAFEKNSERLWTVKKQTVVPVGSKGYVKGQIGLPEGATIEPHIYQFHGVDLVDVLNSKCAR